jgi:hypothetical protein
MSSPLSSDAGAGDAGPDAGPDAAPDGASVMTGAGLADPLGVCSEPYSDVFASVAEAASSHH